MSVAHLRERSSHSSDDVDDLSCSLRRELVPGEPLAVFRAGIDTYSPRQNPAWVTLTGAIVGLNVGSDRVEFVWPSSHDGRQIPAASLPAIMDNYHQSCHAGYNLLEANNSLDQHPHGKSRGPENPGNPSAGVKRFGALGEGEEAILEALVREDTLDSVLGDICRLSDSLVAGSCCSILLVDPDVGDLRYGAGPDLPADYRAALAAFSFGSPNKLPDTGIDEKEGLMVVDIASEPACRAFREFAQTHGVRTCWTLPLVAKDVVHGILAIHLGEPHSPDDSEIGILRRLAKLAVIAILRRPDDGILLRNAERHALAVKSADIGIWEWDIEEGTLYWSPLLKSMIGMNQEEEPVPGKTFRSLLHPEDQEPFDEMLRRHLTEQQQYDIACRIRQPDGDYRWIRIKAQATWSADGRPARLAGCVQDITDQKRAEDKLRSAWDAAEAASRAKSLFLATISQELQTPLNTILGMGEILKDTVVQPPGGRWQVNKAVVQRSSRQLLELIESIIDMARLEAEHVEIHEEVVALSAVLDEAIQSVRLSQRAPRHRLTLDLPSPLPVLAADRRCLKQVLINVLSDAVKSTPKDGRVAVKVSRSGEALEIMVEDGGPGNAHNEAPNILHPLYRLESVMAQQQQGNAVGLFISKVLIERHGGTMQVESRPDRGRAVYIRLPAGRLPADMMRQGNGPGVWRHIARKVI